MVFNSYGKQFRCEIVMFPLFIWLYTIYCDEVKLDIEEEAAAAYQTKYDELVQPSWLR